jgi:peptide/nickel transport system substrate-binding protein
MKKLRWQIVVVIVALVAIGVILVSQQPASILPGVIPAPVIEPAQGGVYTEGLVGEFGRLNPVMDYYDTPDRSVDRLLYSGLIRFDGRGQPYGDLAETWGISQDEKIYNFSIRSNAVWHDGQPVTSADVIFTIDLLRDENTPIPADLKDFWNQVEVEALDDKTLQFRLPEPFAPFLDYLTFGVLPQHIWEETAPEAMIDSPLNLKPVGSGPYQFDTLLVEDGKITGVQLAAFKDYYSQAPFIDQFVFKYYPDEAAVLAAYENGDVLGVGQIDRTELPAMLEDANLGVYTGRQPRLGLVYMNLDAPDLPFFQDAGLRRALLMGINRQRIIDRQLQSQGFVADGPIMPGTWAYYDSIEHLTYDPEQALSAIKEAGYTIPAEGGGVRVKEGVQFEFELAYPDQEPYTSIAQSIAADWSQLGVKADLKPVPYETLLTDYLEPGTYQAALVDLNLGRTPDPDPYPFWHQAQITGGQNYAHWDDRQASEYLEQARVEVDQAERLKRYKNFQVRFTSQMPALPLYYLVGSYGIDRSVQGVRVGALFDPSDRFNDVTNWYLATTRTAQQSDGN